MCSWRGRGQRGESRLLCAITDAYSTNEVKIKLIKMSLLAIVDEYCDFTVHLLPLLFMETQANII